MWRIGWVVGAWVAVAAFAGSGGDEIAERVVDGLQSARREAGAGELERRDDLDTIARSRAAQLAALPHRQRLVAGGPVAEDLQRAGIRFRRASLHLDLNRGYPDPAHGFVKTWSRQGASWTAALSSGYDAVGIATTRAEDGWIVLAAVLLEIERPRPAPVSADLEARTVAAINDARLDHGHAALEVDGALTDLARAHSRDMVRQGYFEHEAPDGTVAADRARRHGVAFVRIGENLHKNAGFDDSAAAAVRSWLSSRSHRKLLLAPEFRTTGVGVAMDDDGTVYFTQLFVAPPDPSDTGCNE